jgi:hypothetical protein
MLLLDQNQTASAVSLVTLNNFGLIVWPCADDVSFEGVPYFVFFYRFIGAGKLFFWFFLLLHWCRKTFFCGFFYRFIGAGAVDSANHILNFTKRFSCFREIHNRITKAVNPLRKKNREGRRLSFKT